VSGDKLVGDVVEVGADNMGLRTDPKNVVADALNQRRFPARRDGAERVPRVNAAIGKPADAAMAATAG
jgi:hypothetical protein